jgi:hypothetical protein
MLTRLAVSHLEARLVEASVPGLVRGPNSHRAVRKGFLLAGIVTTGITIPIESEFQFTYRRPIKIVKTGSRDVLSSNG